MANVTVTDRRKKVHYPCHPDTMANFAAFGPAHELVIVLWSFFSGTIREPLVNVLKEGKHLKERFATQG